MALPKPNTKRNPLLLVDIQPISKF